MTPSQKLEIVKQTRKIASETLAKVLKQILENTDPISETQFRDLWLEELRKHSEIFPDGWYIPPPHGIVVLFSNSQNPERTNFRSLRPEEFWPKDNIFLDRNEGIVTLYFSPVHKGSYVVGDFGLTLYLGKNQKLHNQIKKVLGAINIVFDECKIGMELKEVYQYMLDVLAKDNLNNSWWISVNDPTGINIGHTIPPTDEDWTNQELGVLDSNADWQQKASVISKKRKFLNAIEDTKIKSGMTFSIEPRPKSEIDPDIPVFWLHTMALFYENGEKELLTGFDEIFKIAGMDYLL